MPHCVLEYSSNLKNIPDPKKLLEQLNNFIARTLPVEIQKIKSRMLKQDDFIVSDGNRNQAFIHLEVGILNGRDMPTQARLSKELLGFLEEKFAVKSLDMPCSLSVEIRIIEGQSYSRENFGQI